MSANDFNQQVIDEFRANGGKVGGMFEGLPLVLVHHLGARSGAARIAPLAYRAEEARGEERDRLFDAQKALRPQFGEYEQKTERVIPVVVLAPTG